MENDDVAAELARLRALARELLRAIERLESRVSGSQPRITMAPTAPATSPPPATGTPPPPAGGVGAVRVPSLQMPAVRPKKDKE